MLSLTAPASHNLIVDVSETNLEDGVSLNPDDIRGFISHDVWFLIDPDPDLRYPRRSLAKQLKSTPDVLFLESEVEGLTSD